MSGVVLTKPDTLMIDCAKRHFSSATDIAALSMKLQEADINTRIWQVVSMIPPGNVVTYGDVAVHAGLPGGARRVGHALRLLPPDTRIPWHRVINAQGGISLPKGSPSYCTQRKRLASEGVLFRNHRVVDMGKYRWKALGDDQ